MANLSSLVGGSLVTELPDNLFPAILPAVSGENLTDLNASNVASGTIADARLTANVVITTAEQTITNKILENYAIQGSAIGNTGATRTIDLEVANFFSATLDESCAFTFSNPPASGDFGAFVLELTNGGAFAITWPDSVDFPGGVAPTLTASGVDQLVFTTRDAGTTWFGFVAGLDIKSP
jgi:hypothetical protein